jgi:hypothetical protein
MTTSDGKFRVLVTVHGIGFEQSPDDENNRMGYADKLHANLRECLQPTHFLSDDPNRPKEKGGIYVESSWEDDNKSPSREAGLKRLGVWSTQNRTKINGNVVLSGTKTARLISHEDYKPSKTIAHVALVYSKLETPPANELLPAIGVFGSALLSVSQYSSPLNLLKFGAGVAFANFAAPFKEQDVAPAVGSLRPRTDMDSRHQVKAPDGAPDPATDNPLKYLIDDVASYVVHNDERERVRSFVREALTRLARRKDVSHIILNTHSNGTVVAFDVLRHLPSDVSERIAAFVTAGSPLRKYVDLFDWGTEVQCSYRYRPWYNFWDENDPVADPLDPPKNWRRGDPTPPSDEKTVLFKRIALDENLDQYSALPLYDLPVDNAASIADGGLRTHNYWDNLEFVRALACILREVNPSRERVLEAMGRES